MAHYNGPKARINRRLGAQIYENTGVLRSTSKRNTPPGMARPRGRKSVYGESLAEKQKIKYFYGISERQLRKMYATSKRQKGNTGDNLKVLCERRLDNVVRRAGFCRTRPQARQGIAHGHFLVNGVPTNVASFLVRPGDVVTVRKNEKLQEMYKLTWAEIGTPADLGWIVADGNSLTLTVTSYPLPEDFTAPVDKIGLVIEFLAR